MNIFTGLRWISGLMTCLRSEGWAGLGRAEVSVSQFVVSPGQKMTGPRSHQYLYGGYILYSDHQTVTSSQHADYKRCSAQSSAPLINIQVNFNLVQQNDKIFLGKSWTLHILFLESRTHHHCYVSPNLCPGRVLLPRQGDPGSRKSCCGCESVWEEQVSRSTNLNKLQIYKNGLWGFLSWM